MSSTGNQLIVFFSRVHTYYLSLKLKKSNLIKLLM